MKGWRAVVAVVMPALIAAGVTWQFSRGQEPDPVAQATEIKVAEVMQLLADLDAALTPYRYRANGEPNISTEFAITAISKVRLELTRYSQDGSAANRLRFETSMTDLQTALDRAKQDR